MAQVLSFINFGILAENNIFELLGPLVLFGIYALVALTKKLANSQSDSGGKPSEDLQRAVREKYKEIHARQTGKKPPAAPKFEPQRKTESTRPVTIKQKFERPAPIRQTEERRTYPVQIQKQQRPVRQIPRTEPRYRPRAVRSNIQTPKPIKATHKPEKKIVSPKKQQPHILSVYTAMLRQPQNLRSAIILKEILDKPVSMRGIY